MQTCKLCNENRELRESHIIPRFLYRYMIKVTDNNLTQFSGALNLWQRSNRQLTKKLLCSDCEQRLGSNETEFSDVFRAINLEKDRSIFSYGELGDEDYKKLLEKGFVKEEVDEVLNSSPIYNKLDVIRFFAISYIFRELVNNSYDVPKNEIDKMKLFLKGKYDLKFMLTVRIHNAEPEFNLFSTVMVMDGLPDWKHYVFYIPNIQFHVAINTEQAINEVYKTIIIPSNFFEDEIETLKQLKKHQSGARIANNITKT
ncbi:hypothetical protein [Vibrio parahaemolyticus]|uniref:hypothetical protein n=1 Tax=Vibrio parahaemolyticus TaxID=670 RepID=UPI00111D60D6|nr:hypothetical protein [Vibrio parahaemolyticus]EJV0610147.1 hypothetical protein [Vibrio parahaemolyticus]ELB2069225.1 hypothetical protein [Vibrio parahaemolyticus]ELB2117225.1 hypothetical protein [Vibrio parahaemolyticus]MBM5175374.1 hypothetical protein [Vibrio parahaemolyticus]MBM5189201.1 hypothetical protein [Vibrio parahaemolyticus]